MKINKHFRISSIKSIIRIAACLVAIGWNSIVALALGLAIAEVFGFIEEVVDDR